MNQSSDYWHSAVISFIIPTIAVSYHIDHGHTATTSTQQPWLIHDFNDIILQIPYCPITFDSLVYDNSQASSQKIYSIGAIFGQYGGHVTT